MKTSLSLFLILFTMISCQNANNKDKNKIITFDIKERPDITDVKLSDLGFNDIEYIPLETNEHCMIPRIMYLKVGNDFFLTQFQNTILKFLSDGSFVTRIGTEGRGPNEFLVAHDVEIDEKNQDIYIVDGWDKKFYIYSESGGFIRTTQILQNIINFKFTKDGILCYSLNSYGDVENSFNLINTDGRTIKSFHNRYPFNKYQKDSYGMEYENIFYRFNNRLFKKEVYSDTVYVFENMSFKPHLVIEAGKRLITPAARSEFSGPELAKNYIIPRNLLEFGDYIYYEFIYELIIGKKNISYGLVGSKKNDFQAFINSESGFINDLDSGPNIWPKTIKDDNTIICWVDALQLKSHVASEAFKNSKPKYPEKKKELEKLANSLKETDNPVLMIVRLKK